MHSLGKLVFDTGVGCHLAAALCASPNFSGTQELPADALAAPMFLDEPTFHIADGAGNVAAVRARSKASFEKSHKSAISFFCDEND